MVIFKYSVEYTRDDGFESIVFVRRYTCLSYAIEAYLGCFADLRNSCCAWSLHINDIASGEVLYATDYTHFE